MILVIKHGALGDIIQATEAFRAIKEYHKNDKMVLMVRKPFVNFAKTIPFFDSVIVDECPKINPIKYYKTLKEIAKYDKIYDLQHSNRTARYFKILKLFKKLPALSTIPTKFDRSISAFHIFKEQLKISNIDNYGDYPCLDFMQEKITSFNLPKNFALIIAGCSLRGANKKWTSQGFAGVARYLSRTNIIPVFIGTSSDTSTINNIIKLIPGIPHINLCGQTNLNQLATLGRQADLALGIDTGPIHIVAGIGCKTFVLFNTKYTNSKKSLAIGKNINPIESNDLSKMTYNEVISKLIFN